MTAWVVAGLWADLLLTAISFIVVTARIIGDDDQGAPRLAWFAYLALIAWVLWAVCSAIYALEGVM